MNYNTYSTEELQILAGQGLDGVKFLREMDNYVGANATLKTVLSIMDEINRRQSNIEI